MSVKQSILKCFVKMLLTVAYFVKILKNFLRLKIFLQRSITKLQIYISKQWKVKSEFSFIGRIF